MGLLLVKRSEATAIVFAPPLFSFALPLALALLPLLFLQAKFVFAAAYLFLGAAYFVTLELFICHKASGCPAFGASVCSCQTLLRFRHCPFGLHAAMQPCPSAGLEPAAASAITTALLVLAPTWREWLGPCSRSRYSVMCA